MRRMKKNASVVSTDEPEILIDMHNGSKNRTKRVKVEKDPLAVPQTSNKRRAAASKKPVLTKAARKQSTAPAEYEVKDIVDHRAEGKTTFYRVRWVGYSAEDDTWEQKSSLSCENLLTKYHAKIKKAISPKKATAARGKPKKNVAVSRGIKKKPAKPIKSKSPKKAGATRGRPKLTASPAAKKVAPKKKATKLPEPEWDVEDIVAVRGQKSKQEFLVKWKGWDSSENTWEPINNLNCQKIISRFRKRERAAAKAAKSADEIVATSSSATIDNDDEEPEAAATIISDDQADDTEADEEEAVAE